MDELQTAPHMRMHTHAHTCARTRTHAHLETTIYCSKAQVPYRDREHVWEDARLHFFVFSLTGECVNPSF